MQAMNQERDQHLIEKKEQWRLYQKDLHDYQQMMVNRDNDAVDKEKKDSANKRMERTQTAHFNIECYHK